MACGNVGISVFSATIDPSNDEPLKIDMRPCAVSFFSEANVLSL